MGGACVPRGSGAGKPRPLGPQRPPGLRRVADGSLLREPASPGRGGRQPRSGPPAGEGKTPAKEAGRVTQPRVIFHFPRTLCAVQRKEGRGAEALCGRREATPGPGATSPPSRAGLRSLGLRPPGRSHSAPAPAPAPTRHAGGAYPVRSAGRTRSFSAPRPSFCGGAGAGTRAGPGPARPGSPPWAADGGARGGLQRPASTDVSLKEPP